jgi:hypothetical protein
MDLRKPRQELIVVLVQERPAIPVKKAAFARVYGNVTPVACLFFVAKLQN